MRFSRQLVGAVLLVGCAHRAAPVAAPTPIVAPVVVAVEPPAPAPIPRVLKIVRPVGEDASPIFSVHASDARVYFNDGAGRLWSAPKDGSSPATAIVDDPDDSVRSFVIDGDSIYYAARTGLRSVSIDGGESKRVGENRTEPILVVSDGQNVYYTVFDGSGTYRASMTTRRSERFFGGSKHQTLAVDDTNLYVASYYAGTITAVSKKTRRARLLATNVRRPVRLVADDAFVYFTSETDGSVRRVSKRGGRVEVLARGQRGSEHLALDDGRVYWATRGALMRCTPGGEPEELYTGLGSAAGITVDDGFVFVADRSAGEVVRVMKN